MTLAGGFASYFLEIVFDPSVPGMAYPQGVKVPYRPK